MKIEYIDGKHKLGIQYDWNLISKEYKRLKCPKEYNNPLTNGIDKAHIHLLVSERSTGKTTNLILVGIIMYYLYGTTTQYIRANDKIITYDTRLKLVGELKVNSNLVKGAPSNYTKMMDTLDQLNYLGNNFAVTSGDMSNALSRFANVANSSGISIDQALSYAMATQESVQNSEKVGNGLIYWPA